MPVAIGAFVAFDVFIIALVLTAWALATIVMFKPVVVFLANAAGDIPVIGGWLSDELNNLETYVQRWIANAVTDAYRAGATPFIELMNTYANTKSGELYSQSIVNGMTYNAIATVASHAVGTVNEPTQNYITNVAGANTTYVTNNYQADITQSYTYTEASYGQLADWANNAIQSVYNDVVAADGRVSTLATSVSADLQQTRDYAASVAATAEANAVNLAGDYTKESFLTGEDYTTKVRDYATAINADTRTWAEGEISTKTNDVAAALDSKIAIVATVAAATETAFADFMNNCGEPLCGGLTGLAKAFLGTKDLLGTALLLGFIEEAVSEPEQTADATVAVADVILSPAKTIVSDIFGG